MYQLHQLYQNIQIFIYVFPFGNKIRIFKFCKSCHLFRLFLVIMMFLILLLFIYFCFVGSGIFTSYILNNESYDILSGCFLNNTNCTIAELYCNARYDSLFISCSLLGLLSLNITLICPMLILIISYHMMKYIYKTYTDKNEKTLLLSEHKISSYQNIDDKNLTDTDDINLEIYDFDESDNA